MEEKIKCGYCDGMANLQEDYIEMEVEGKFYFKSKDANYYKCEKCRKSFTVTPIDDQGNFRYSRRHRDTKLSIIHAIVYVSGLIGICIFIYHAIANIIKIL